jgi:hypothetical protein
MLTALGRHFKSVSELSAILTRVIIIDPDLSVYSCIGAGQPAPGRICVYVPQKPSSIPAFAMFFLALRVRSPYSARRAWLVLFASRPRLEYLILRRRTKLDGKTNEQVQDRRAHGR